MHSISKEQVFVNLFCFTFPPNKQKRINLPGQKNNRTYYFCRGAPRCSFPLFIPKNRTFCLFRLAWPLSAWYNWDSKHTGSESLFFEFTNQEIGRFFSCWKAFRYSILVIAIQRKRKSFLWIYQSGNRQVFFLLKNLSLYHTLIKICCSTE